jgi:hypothetical protein
VDKEAGVGFLSGSRRREAVRGRHQAVSPLRATQQQNAPPPRQRRRGPLYGTSEESLASTAPEPRDHQHVGVAYPLLERRAVAHLEALNAGPERQEALAQPIGNMRKTDRQLVLGREHGVTSEFVGYADDSTQDNEPNAGLPPKRRIKFQVGNHLGVVVKESVLNTNSANSQRVHNLPHAGPRL